MPCLLAPGHILLFLDQLWARTWNINNGYILYQGAIKLLGAQSIVWCVGKTGYHNQLSYLTKCWNTTGNKPINLALAFNSFQLPIVSFVAANRHEIMFVQMANCILIGSQPNYILRGEKLELWVVVALNRLWLFVNFIQFHMQYVRSYGWGLYTICSFG